MTEYKVIRKLHEASVRSRGGENKWNPLGRLVDWVYGLFGYSTIEVPLAAEERDQLEERARRIGFTFSQYCQAIWVKYLLNHEEEVAEALANQKRLRFDVSP
jgi:hypothetical protein